MKIKNMKNMKKYILILSVIGGTLLMTACTDWLDMRPHNYLDTETAISTVEEGRTAVLGGYERLRGATFYGRNVFVCGDAGSQDLALRTDNSSRYINQYRWNIQSGDAFGGEMWAAAYSAINRVNEVIRVLPTKVSQSAARDQVLGEAYFIRALCHYELVKFFGQAYNYPEASDIKGGIPYITTPTMLNNHGRETKASNFENIIDDLTTALELMSVDRHGLEPYIVGSDAVKALLARVYLYMACTNGTSYFTEAAKYAEQVIEGGNYKLATPAQYRITANADNTEFTSELWGDRYGVETIFAFPTNSTERNATNSLGNIYLDKKKGYGDLVVTEEFVDLFEPGDVRQTMIYLFDDANEHWCVGKHMGNGKAGGWDLAYTKIFRVAEMYLISAEANARTGNQAQALKRINELRAQRGLTDLPTATIDAILKERRLELCFEGHALADHKRLNTSIVRGVDEGNPEHQNLGLVYPNDKFAYPIPEGELTVNHHEDMKQNPGYGL